jgi:predicted permease
MGWRPRDWSVGGGAFPDTLQRDVRHGARMLRRSPVFAATATLSMAIGIGASTSVFTVMNGLLLRAAAGVSDPGAIVDVVRRERDGGPGVAELSYPSLRDVMDRATTLESVYGYRLQPASISLRVGDAAAEPAFADLVTTNFFTTLGVRAATGRLFEPADGQRPDAGPLVVLSHRFWARRFQADPSVLGRVVHVNGRPLTIIGVVDEGFRGLTVTAPDVWMPVSMAGMVFPDAGSRILQDRGMPFLMAGARLKPGTSRAQASAEVAAIGAALEREGRSTEARTAPPLSGVRGVGPGGFAWSVEPASPIPYGLRPLAAGFLALLMALVSTVLVIACANLAGVLLARGVARRQEMAVRTALGVGRLRLIRQLLTETLLLYALGGAAGLLLARGLLALLVRLLPAFSVPVNLSAPLDGRVVAFALGLSLVAAVLSGLTPALHASRADVVSSLKDEVQGTSDRLRLRHAFVVAQIAFSILLVAVAALLVRGFDRQSAAKHGFDPAGVAIASVDLSQAGYTSVTGPAFARRLLEAVRTAPEFDAVSIADHPPEPGGRSLGSVAAPGTDHEPGAFFSWTVVAPRYFATVRIPVVAGRDFTDADLDGAEPLVVLGAAAARRLFASEAGAIGRYVVLGSHVVSSDGTPSPPAPARVVGVVGDVQFGPTAPSSVYVPLSYRYQPGLTILARSRASGGDRAAKLREIVTRLDANLPVLRVGSLEQHGSGPLETQLRIAATVAAAVAVVGLWLAGLGVYGVTAYTVAQRTREIGIRISLGATAGQVAWFVLGQSVRLAALGCAIGFLLAVAAGRLLAQGRHGLPAFDPAAFAGAAALFALVCLVACAIPVRRAIRIEAIEALRYR